MSCEFGYLFVTFGHESYMCCYRQFERCVDACVDDVTIKMILL